MSDDVSTKYGDATEVARWRLSSELKDVVALIKFIYRHEVLDADFAGRMMGVRIAAQLRNRDDIEPWDGTGKSPSHEFYEQAELKALQEGRL